MTTTMSEHRYADGALVARHPEHPAWWVAVTPRGLRLRDADTRLVKLYPSPEAAAFDLGTLGYGPARSEEAA